MRLSDRLEAVLKMVGGAGANDCSLAGDATGAVDDSAGAGAVECLADIGTDHGLVPIEAVRRGFAKRAVASDIGEGPIKAARENIERAGLSGRIETVVADGLAGVRMLMQGAGDAGVSSDKDAAAGEGGRPHPDTIVIAGMGGMLMKKILIEGDEVARCAKKLILSPQSDLEMFRRFLCDNDYEIMREECIKEDGKYYFVMCVRPSNAKAYAAADCKYGRREHFSKESQLVRKELIRRDLANYKKIAASLEEKIDGAASDETCDGASHSKQARLLEIQKEIILLEGILNGI